MRRGKKEVFHIGEILSVTTGRPVSVRENGESEVINFMCRGSIPEEKLPVARQLAREHLLKQFPNLGGPEMEDKVKFLDAQLAAATDKKQLEWARSYWRNEVAAKTGSVLTVESIPTEDLVALSDDTESAVNK